MGRELWRAGRAGATRAAMGWRLTPIPLLPAVGAREAAGMVALRRRDGRQEALPADAIAAKLREEALRSSDDHGPPPFYSQGLRGPGSARIGDAVAGGGGDRHTGAA